ncbi:DnaJ (Hsp40), subfamily C, member 11 [Clarireedia jacksonii]
MAQRNWLERSFDEHLENWWLDISEVPEDWCSKDHIPHYFNLNVPINATTHDIKQAYRRLSILIHPDKIRNLKFKAEATQALILVTNAFDTLSDPKKRNAYTITCRKPGWGEYCPTQDQVVKKHVLAWEKRRLRSKQQMGLQMDQQKPWWWEYTPIQKIGLDTDTTNLDGFCTATWVNLAHLIVDNSLPTRISDRIWQHAQQWRTKATPSERETEMLSFYKGCDEIVLQVERAKVPPRWSLTQSDTDWATLGSFNDLFCPDILIFPIAICGLITIYLWYILYKRFCSVFGPHTGDRWHQTTSDSPTATVILNLPTRTPRGFTPYPTPRTLAKRPVSNSDDENTEVKATLPIGCVGTTASRRPCNRKVSVNLGQEHNPDRNLQEMT